MIPACSHLLHEKTRKSPSPTSLVARRISHRSHRLSNGRGETNRGDSRSESSLIGLPYGNGSRCASFGGSSPRKTFSRRRQQPFKEGNSIKELTQVLSHSSSPRPLLPTLSILQHRSSLLKSLRRILDPSLNGRVRYKGDESGVEYI